MYLHVPGYPGNTSHAAEIPPPVSLSHDPGHMMTLIVDGHSLRARKEDYVDTGQYLRRHPDRENARAATRTRSVREVYALWGDG